MRRAPEYRTRLAREMRRAPTESEGRLWEVLRDRQIDGARFRRQRPIDRYIADFCCDDARLIVEIDGEAHDGEVQRDYDTMRDEYLQANGYHIVHLSVEDVMERLPDSLARIRSALRNSPLPLRERGRG